MPHHEEGLSQSSAGSGRSLLMPDGLSYARFSEATGVPVSVHHRHQSQLAIVFCPATGLTTYTSLDYIESPGFPTFIWFTAKVGAR